MNKATNDEQTSPTENGKSLPEEQTLVVEDWKSIQEEQTLVVEDWKSIQQEHTSVAEDLKIQEERTSVVEDWKSIQEEHTSVAEDLKIQEERTVFQAGPIEYNVYDRYDQAEKEQDETEDKMEHNSSRIFEKVFSMKEHEHKQEEFNCWISEDFDCTYQPCRMTVFERHMNIDLYECDVWDLQLERKRLSRLMCSLREELLQLEEEMSYLE
jgi:hypothetical protein